jgi:hypothetical protein
MVTDSAITDGVVFDETVVVSCYFYDGRDRVSLTR